MHRASEKKIETQGCFSKPQALSIEPRALPFFFPLKKCSTIHKYFSMFLHRLLKYFEWPHNIPSIGQAVIFLTVPGGPCRCAPRFTVINNAGGKRSLSLPAISLGPVPRTGINGSKSRRALKAFDVPAKRLSARALPARSPADVSGACAPHRRAPVPADG